MKYFGLDGAKLFHFHGKFKDNETHMYASTCTRMYASTCTRMYVSDIIAVHDYAVSINMYEF